MRACSPVYLLANSALASEHSRLHLANTAKGLDHRDGMRASGAVTRGDVSALLRFAERLARFGCASRLPVLLFIKALLQRSDT
jgi:hypothetical protein